MEIINVKTDIIVVGLGPTGLTLTSLLGEQGHSVVAVERWPNLYGKPRLTHIDGETARLIDCSCDADAALRDAWVTPHYKWTNGKGQLLLDPASGNTRKMVWDDNISVHQPHIEECLLERIQGYDNVQLFRGFAASQIRQDEEGVHLSGREWRRDEASDAPEQEIRITAKYLVGADGSNSFVRDAVGITRKDFGFNERWLCVDTTPKAPLPTKFNENAVQVCDPKRGYMFMPIGHKRQRFEFALLPDETTDVMATPETAHRLLEEYHGIRGDDVDLIRTLVYTFECRLAETWRAGRVFLAGDAAHTNPPYLGQGGCSGMRDASNLAWKFDLVLRGLSDDALLDTYELERSPHAQRLMLDSRSLGKIANTRSRVLATIRDLMFRFKLAPTPKFPVLTDGVLARTTEGDLHPQAGTVPAQGHVAVGDEAQRLDQITGFSFVLLSRTDLSTSLTEDAQRVLEDLRVASVRFGPDAAQDVDGVYANLFDELNADVILVRPDFVLYGHASKEGANDLLEGLAEALQVPGSARPTGPARPA